MIRMAELTGRDSIESFRMELEDIRSSIGTSFHRHVSSFRSTSDRRPVEDNDDELQLQWAAIERLPTFQRIRTSLFDHQNPIDGKEDKQRRVTDVTKLRALERHVFIDKLLKQIEEDNKQLLQKQRERTDRVGLVLPTIEVRYQNLSVEAECEVVQGKPLPTLWNTLKSFLQAILCINKCKNQASKIKILHDVNGIIKPSRITLLLGPPGCGKTTLLLALAGKLKGALQVLGEISYNGYTLNEFIPQKTSAYISQHDVHMSEMTVRETLDFSARCQGNGNKAETMKEVTRREKQAGIVPEPDIDTYMKAISMEGLKSSLQTDYILKILGLDNCADTIVGDAMRRGVSGGQKKRITTGEIIIGPNKALLMDEISTGLDSCTTFQIVTYLQQLAHIAESTILISLLQPEPETFDLFDDIILMAEGQIVYHGPRSNVLDFFEMCGFRCPQRKGIADFLQEVISIKDQAQYWYRDDKPYSYVSVGKFGDLFKECHVGQKLNEDLSRPFDKSEHFKSALSFSVYSLKRWELFQACLAREWLLMKRNANIHVSKSLQLLVTAIITMTVFIRTRMLIDVEHANYYMGALFFALIRLMTTGIAELALTVARLPVLYKQRDFFLYPEWAFTVPACILKIPFSSVDAFLWTTLTYYTIGYSPEPQRFFSQMLLLFLVHQVSISIFRLVAAVFQKPAVAASCGLFVLLVMFLFGGFIIPKPSFPSWLKWGFWISPLSYAEIGASLNEFLAPRWQKVSSSNQTLGQEVLTKHGLYFSGYYYWVSVGALLGFWILLNLGFTIALSYSKAPGTSRAIISHEKFAKLQQREDSSNRSQNHSQISTTKGVLETKDLGVVLPFEPVTVTFHNIQYFVDTPKELTKQGLAPKRLQLLQDITGAFRPGILTALMGVSGAGKTTLLDVLSGRKTGGFVAGEINVGGHPKVQDTYARISAYCEQTDMHSPNITVEESVAFSAWLRLPSELDKATKSEFVHQVLQMIELDEIRDAIVGVPGVSGISTEQRKRLTIAVELVSNPSIIFMDEPTSGLDARAAAIVMRVVKNIVRTRRTVVCTIHQPSFDIFEAFDELILMKRGGQIIYSGELGHNSNKLIQYFEGISGVPKMRNNYNPATWMLEVTSPSIESQIQVDFAQLYIESGLYRETKELVQELSHPTPDSKGLYFSTRFSQNGWEQFKACLWKQHLSYWRNPEYNLTRLLFATAASLLFGALFWRKGKKMDDEQSLFNMLGANFIFVQFLGINNCSPVLPYVATERTVMYRERFAGMYSSWAYSFAQVVIEIPYIFLQSVLIVTITYPAIDYYCSVYKIFWYSYAIFCTLLYFNYLGLLLVALSPSFQAASVWVSFSYTLLNLFSGYLIPEPKIPKWWVWLYWICPNAWSLKGLLTSQYGDIKKEINAFGERKAVNEFLRSYFGYHHDQLGLVAVVLFVVPLLFAILFACSMSRFNFQRR